MDIEFNRTFRVVNFPFDRHLLLASFENSRHPRDELVFLPDEASSAVSRRATTVGYGIERFHAVENPHSYQTSRGWPGIPADRRGPWSQPRFALEIVRQGWGQFLLADNTVDWRKVVLAGHSQGGGHVGVLAKSVSLNRAVYFSSPEDWYDTTDTPASWSRVN